jgi:hypothetical protein
LLSFIRFSRFARYAIADCRHATIFSRFRRQPSCRHYAAAAADDDGEAIFAAAAFSADFAITLRHIFFASLAFDTPPPVAAADCRRCRRQPRRFEFSALRLPR